MTDVNNTAETTAPAAAENPPQKASKPKSINVVKLTDRFQYEDFDLTEINLKLDSLSGHMSEEVDRQWDESGFKSEVKEDDRRYALLVASMTSGIPAEVLRRLPLEDYYAVTLTTQRFLSQKVLRAAKPLQELGPLL